MRHYPKVAGSYNHKKMEQAFLRALRHILSKQYQYVIVADRGFGNARFMQYCEAMGFDYLIRIAPNMRVSDEAESGLLRKHVTETGKQSVYFEKWSIRHPIFMHQKDQAKWYLISNMKALAQEEALKIYENRFKIEGVFKDLKSAGFNIERSKIKKYDRCKRLLALCMLAHVIVVMTGKFIKEKAPAFLKNFPLHGAIISACFPKENKLF